ncbi:MAG TPA: response regulator, partial [Polyangium sp.]|nr:response regulator [Polyangium sp.]
MAQRRQRVLIVDDEDGIVLALHRFLYQDNHRYDVLLAKNAEIGRQILRETPVDVLVTDVHLPGMSGMDLVCWAAVETPDTRAIVMTAFDVNTIRDKAHAVGCLKLIRKPFDLHELRAAILQAMEIRDSLLGSLSELSAVDVIQMLCLGRKTTALRIARGQSSGVILIQNGDIVHGIWDNIVGEDAVHEMIAVEDGVFNMAPFPPDFERTIYGDYQHILMEGVRKLDEKARGGPMEDEPAPRPSVRPGRIAAAAKDEWSFEP